MVSPPKIKALGPLRSAPGGQNFIASHRHIADQMVAGYHSAPARCGRNCCLPDFADCYRSDGSRLAAIHAHHPRPSSAAAQPRANHPKHRHGAANPPLVRACRSGETVNPLAITRRSSPITSDRIYPTTGAGAASRRNPPPFSAESCWRTKFISVISNPAAKRARFTAALSARVSPATGAGNKAEPPPGNQRHDTVRCPSRRAQIDHCLRRFGAVFVRHRMTCGETL